MWEKKSDDGTIHDVDNTYTWSSSGSAPDGTAFAVFLNSLNVMSFAGHSDWRLPEVNIINGGSEELDSLSDLTESSPKIFSEFKEPCTSGCTVLTCKCTASSWYWSSATYADFPDYAWGVDFDDGLVFYTHKYNDLHVRAVRGGS